MPNFVLSEIEAIEGEQQFYQLEIDGIKQLDDFESSLGNSRYKSELNTLYLYMEYVAQLKALPSNKFKDITPPKENVKEYEFKSKHLRLYAIKTKAGKVILMGGFKNRQKSDIRRFRSLKASYLKSLI